MGTHKDGKEYLDPTPLSVPAGFKRPESIHEMIKRYIRTEQFREKAEAAGVDTEAEANDFEVEDEEDMVLTRHEISAMAAEELKDLEGEKMFRQAKQRLQDEYEKRMMDLHANYGMQPRDKEQSNGNDEKRASDSVESAGAGGEKRAASGGKGRAAGRGGKRVSEVRRSDRGVDEEGGRGDREE